MRRFLVCFLARVKIGTGSPRPKPSLVSLLLGEPFLLLTESWFFFESPPRENTWEGAARWRDSRQKDPTLLCRSEGFMVASRSDEGFREEVNRLVVRANARRKDPLVSLLRVLVGRCCGISSCASAGFFKGDTESSVEKEDPIELSKRSLPVKPIVAPGLLLLLVFFLLRFEALNGGSRSGAGDPSEDMESSLLLKVLLLKFSFSPSSKLSSSSSSSARL